MNTRAILVRTVGLALSVSWATACAGQARISATDKIVAAERSIQDATQSEAALIAVPDLDAAQTRLVEAKAAAEAHKWDDASRLADEAQADADYALAQAVAQKAVRASHEMGQNVQLLRRELERTGR